MKASIKFYIEIEGVSSEGWATWQLDMREPKDES